MKMHLFIWYCFWQSVGTKIGGMHHTNMEMRKCALSPSFKPFVLSVLYLVALTLTLYKQVEALFYLILPNFWKSSAFWKHPRLCPFVLLVRLYVWSIDGVLLTGKNRSTRRKTCVIATFCTTYLTWIKLRWYPGQRLRSLSHGRPWRQKLTWIIFKDSICIAH